MTDFPKYLLVVTAEIDAEVAEAWNDWYDNVHFPDALACPGVLRGTRYVAAGPASLMDHGRAGNGEATTYTTVYELSGPEALETPAFKAMRGWHDFKGRIRSRTQLVVRRGG